MKNNAEKYCGENKFPREVQEALDKASRKEISKLQDLTVYGLHQPMRKL